ncbi:MAG TPA: TRAM domain-containing protein [Myxococcota bacterium]
MESVELRIDELAAGGDGVGRGPDGRVVFVPFTAPGDFVRVRVTESRARFARARVEALLEPGPQRCDPVCPVFGSCGGCAWQHVAYPAQLAAKARILEDALRRLGRLEPPGSVEVMASPSAYGYRSRARVLVQAGRVGFRRLRSHAVCATSRCPVLLPALDEKLHELAQRPPSRDGEWELAWGDGSARAVPLAAPGLERIAMQVAGERIGISPGVFAQANALLLPALAARLLALAGAGGRALELYSGAGCFTLPLARRFEQLVALEASPDAARDLRANLTDARIENVEVLAETLESALARGGFAALAPEALVLDPPRAGLPEGAAETLAGLAPARVVYLSCDPATLARDLASFALRGYALRSLEGFDLFPQTPHVEALALLERD